MVDGLDLSRRDFMLVGSTSFMAFSGGPMQIQPPDTGSQPIDEYEFQGVADLMGPADARPAAGSEFFDNKVFYAYHYVETGGGSRWFITQDDAEWAELPTHLPGFLAANLPSDPANGTLYFDQNRNIPTWWDTDHYEFPTFVDDVLVESVNVANTTTRTVVFDPDINANSLVKGRKYQIDLSGTFTTANNSDTFTVDVNLASVTDAAGIGNVGGNVSSPAPWSVEFSFTVREHGQNGELQPHTKPFGVICR